MNKTIAALLLVTFASLSINAQLVPKDAVPEKVADGYKFTEGPALGPDGCIYFTDIPAELILKFDPDSGETTTVVENSGRANGLMFDHDGDLIACQHKARTLSSYTIPRRSKLHRSAVQQHYEGKKLNSPNDLAIDKAGNIYFTDPRYGNRDSMEIEIEGVYFQSIEPDQAPVFDKDGDTGRTLPVMKPLNRIDAELTRPNGIILSPDESILYVADHGENYIYAYDIESPGKVKNKRQFARLNDGKGGGSDGMTIDNQGRLYATGHGKVWVFEPTGQLVATIPVGKQTTNCTFGADSKTLYVTANKGLYRIKLNTDAPLEHAPHTLEDGMGIIEISAALPVHFSASRTTIDINKMGNQWRYQKGQLTLKQARSGGQRSTITEIASGDANMLIRLKLDKTEFSALTKKLSDQNNKGTIEAVSKVGTFSCIGFATHQDSGGSMIEIRPDQSISFPSLPELADNDTIYLYFEVPQDIKIDGISIGAQGFDLNKALLVQP